MDGVGRRLDIVMTVVRLAYRTCNAQANALTVRDAWMSTAPMARVIASMTTLAAMQVA
jgi:hypothetical protein